MFMTKPCIYSSDIMTCNIVILSSKITYMCYIFKINNMKIYLR